MKIVLLGERPVSLNKFYSGMHWAKRSKEAARVHALVKYAIPSGKRKLIRGRVDIFIVAYFKNKPLDSSNIFAKIYEDGLKGVVIADDTISYVGWVATKSEVDKENPRVEIDILDHNRSINPKKRNKKKYLDKKKK